MDTPFIQGIYTSHPRIIIDNAHSLGFKTTSLDDVKDLMLLLTCQKKAHCAFKSDSQFTDNLVFISCETIDCDAQITSNNGNVTIICHGHMGLAIHNLAGHKGTA